MTPLGKTTHAYVGINAAGNVRGICHDDPGEEESTASIVAEWRAMGRAVERLPIAEARRLMRGTGK